MKSSGRNISFLVSKAELDLLDEACEYGADDATPIFLNQNQAISVKEFPSLKTTGMRLGELADYHRKLLRSEILRYAKLAGVSANVKMFRSTFASNLVMSGVDIYAVSKLLGHHNVKITEKHDTHLSTDYMDNVLTEFQPKWQEKQLEKATL